MLQLERDDRRISEAIDSPTRFARIALICEGDAESSDKAFSGSAKSMLDQFRAIGHSVQTVDTRLLGGVRKWAALRSYSPNRVTWRTRMRHGHGSHELRSRIALNSFERLQPAVDAILQIGPSSTPPGGGRVPYTLYNDWNFRLSIQDRHSGHSSVRTMSAREADRIDRLHAGIYEGAACIFTISERLRQSFIEDYGISPDRVVAVHAGPNMDLSLFPDRPVEKPAGHSPTILFIGKEFERKGGDLLLEAFGRIRKHISDARLLIAGVPDLQVAQPGMESLGFLRKDNPDENARHLQAYRDADVFCLPSRHDPFPTVVREAMFFHLPCVTTDIWAMPEMVVDGETGFMVPMDDVDALTDRLLRILGDPDLARKMGRTGRQRAEDKYTWSAAVAKMSDRLQKIVCS